MTATSDSAPPHRPTALLVPCMGVGKIVANVTRRAAYQAQGQCPEDLEILSLPAFLAGDEHERQLARELPALIIDGCALRCAAQIFAHAGLQPAAKVEVGQLMKEFKIGPGKTRKELEATGQRLAGHTTERVLAALQEEVFRAGFTPPLAAPAGAAATPSCAQTACAGWSESSAVPEANSPPAPGPVQGVTILPCQGIKRSGGRITQRAAYLLAEDQFLGRTQVLCITALAAGVPEDVVMFEQFPTLALEGCGKKCASKTAEKFGIPALATVELEHAVPGYDGAAFCREADLNAPERAAAEQLAAAAGKEVERLLHLPEWTPRRADLHGLEHRPGEINALTGFGDPGRGFLVRLAQKAPQNSSAPAPATATVTPRPSAQTENMEVGASVTAENCENYPGLRQVTAGLFKKKAQP